MSSGWHLSRARGRQADRRLMPTDRTGSATLCVAASARRKLAMHPGHLSLGEVRAEAVAVR
jgi:hypothetical protein